MTEKIIRNWRIHGNREGSYLFFDPTRERVSLHGGVDPRLFSLYEEYCDSVSGSPVLELGDRSQLDLPLEAAL